MNGKSLGKIEPGRYLAIDRKWKAGDTIRLTLDMSLHYWVGEKECRGKTSMFRGPILLAYDLRFNEMHSNTIPELDAKNNKERTVRSGSWLAPWLLWEYSTVSGKKVRLCDYASAGAAGQPYTSWLAVRNVSKTPFSRDNPLRSSH